MNSWLFVSDLHGVFARYEKLLQVIETELPPVVLFGGDLLPHALAAAQWPDPMGMGFVYGFLGARFEKLKNRLGSAYPQVFVILGNDDPRSEEAAFLDLGSRGIWTYLHDRAVVIDDITLFGYSFVPPTPFQLKDWERYDVSRYVDPGCVSPEEGGRSVPVAAHHVRYSTIQKDLESMAGESPMDRAVFLFHSPPYETKLDRAALDGKMVDHVPIDVHTGSIAIRRFIEARQPLLTLHGHIHESSRLTGSWRDRIGRTQLFSAAHDGEELAVVRFDPACLDQATRELL